MTKIKKTLWSKMFSVIVGFALVFSVLFGGVVYSNTKKANAGYQQQLIYIGLLLEYSDAKENSPLYDKDAGKYKTDILIEDWRAANIVKAETLYTEVLDENDKGNEQVVLAYQTFQAIWADVFAAPHALIDEMNEKLTPIVKNGVKYSDLLVVAELEEKLTTTMGLDENQQSYVMYSENNKWEVEVDEYGFSTTVPGDGVPFIRNEYQMYLDVVADLEALVAELDQLILDINGLSDIVGNVEYSDKGRIVEIASRYDVLEASALEYVNAGTNNAQNLVDVQVELKAIVDAVIEEVDVTLQEMIDREIVYGDKADIVKFQADYDMLDSEDQAKVTDADNLTQAHNALQAILEGIAENIDVDLQELIDKPIVYSDKLAIMTVADLYDMLDSEDQAKVENELCSDFANLQEALDALNAILADIIHAIDVELEDILAQEFDYSEHRNPIFDIAVAYEMLDDEDKDYVAQTCTDFANLDEAITVVEEYLLALVEAVDVEFEEMLAEGVEYSDKARIFEVYDAIMELEYEDAEYVLEEMVDAENMTEAIMAFQAIIEGVAEDIDVDLEELINKPITYRDKEAVYAVVDAYEMLDDEDKALVADELCSDFANLQEAQDALANLLKDIANAIDNDLQTLIDKPIEYSDKQAIMDVVDAFESLNAEDQAKIENELCSDFANLQEAQDALDALLADIIHAIDVELEDILAQEFDYSEHRNPIFDIAVAYDELDDEDKDYVAQTCTDFANLDEAITVVEEYLLALVEAVDVEFEEMLAEGVEYSDKARIFEVYDAIVELEYEDAEYVLEEMVDAENMTEAIMALQAIIEGVAEDIDVDLEELINKPIEITDKETILAVVDAYEMLDAEDKALVADELCNDFSNLQEAQDALANLLTDIADAIDDDLQTLIDKPIDYTDKEAIMDVVDAFNALDQEDQAKVRDELCDDFANLQEAQDALANLLTDIAEDIDVTLEELINKPIEITDKDVIMDIADAYEALDEEDKAKVEKELCEDFANLAEALEDLQNCQDAVDEVIDAIDNTLEDLINKPIDYSDKETIKDINDLYENLSEEGQKYVEENAEDFGNLAEALEDLKAIQDEIDAIVEYIDVTLPELIANGIRYSYKTQFDKFQSRFEALDAAAQAEVQNTAQVANGQIVATALTEIETRATNANAVIGNILYYVNGEMVADPTGEVVYASDASVNDATAAIAAIYDGSENIALLEYVWDEVEVNALVNAEFLTKLAEYNTALATINSYKETAQAVADQISELVIDETNNYKVLEDTINAIYVEYTALNHEDYNGHHNLQNYIDDELCTTIEDAKVALDAANAWILQVALLINKEATAETADEIIASVNEETIKEMVSFDVDELNAVKESYVVLTGDDSLLAEIDTVMVASVKDAYNVMMLISARIDEIREDLVNDMNGIIDRDGNFQEGDFKLSEEIKDIFGKLDDSQIDDELQDIYDEFFEIAEKLLFVEYFKQAVAELYAEVQAEYFTVEGYVLDKTLLALYNTLDQSYQNLIGDECIDNLHYVDDLYDAQTDLLDYNKIKAEMEELVNSALEDINTNFETLESGLTTKVDNLLKDVEDVKTDLEAKVQEALDSINAKFDAAKAEILADVAEDLGAMQTLLDTLQAKVTEVETNLNDEIGREIAGLKSTLEAQINSVKSDLDKAVKELKDADAALEKKLTDEIDSLKKIVYIGGAVLGVVSLVLLICVFALFSKTSKLKAKVEKKEADEEEPEEEVEEDEEENN